MVDLHSILISLKRIQISSFKWNQKWGYIYEMVSYIIFLFVLKTWSLSLLVR